VLYLFFKLLLFEIWFSFFHTWLMRPNLFKWDRERVLLAGGQWWLTSGQRTWHLHSNCVNRWRFGSLRAAYSKQNVLRRGFNSRLTAPTLIILRNRDVQFCLPSLISKTFLNIFPNFNILSILFFGQMYFVIWRFVVPYMNRSAAHVLMLLILHTDRNLGTHNLQHYINTNLIKGKGLVIWFLVG